MSSSIRNIALVLGFIILLPISIFTIIEIFSINENEKALEKIYRKQLDAIIFSINEYSSTLFTFYFNQIDYQWKMSNQQQPYDSAFIQQNLAIDALAIRHQNQSDIYYINQENTSLISQTQLDSLFNTDSVSTLSNRLMRYKEAGYTKPEPLGEWKTGNNWLMTCLIIIGKDTPCIIFLNPSVFIKYLIAPKVREIGTDELIINVKHTPSNTYLLPMTEEVGIIQTGKLWLFSDYEITVSLKDRSIQDLITSRTQRSILILVLIILMIIIGIVLIVTNLRKEIRLSQAKADFVANVSHEIRTPLSLISMFNETLQLNRVPNEEVKQEYYEIIGKETERLKNIVNKILSFSQIDADKKTYHFAPISPNDEITAIMNTYSYHLEENGFQHSQMLCEEFVTINADKEAFVEVMINLIDNAIKYSEQTKYLLIKTEIQGNNYIVHVTDKGKGIAEKDQHRIFEKFFRVSTGNIYTTKGTGLGLSLIHNIMKAHQGEVTISSKIGSGSTFSLFFPLEKANTNQGSGS